jgi:hypothetical protein
MWFAEQVFDHLNYADASSSTAPTVSTAAPLKASPA